MRLRVYLECRLFNALPQPFNAKYMWLNTTETMFIEDPDVTWMNTYLGGAFQQAGSCLTRTGESVV